MKALTFSLHLLEPVVILDIENGDPDDNVSLSYIPGSVLRGCVIQSFRTSVSSLDAADPLFRRLFLDGTVRYLNAYPLVGEQRALPTPLSWQKFKDIDDEHTARDFCYSQDNHPRQRISEPFCHLRSDENGNGLADLITPKRHLTIHTARDNRQKMTKDQPGAVFRYTSLAAGQTFGAAIVAEDIALLEQAQALLNKRLHWQVGKSRGAGYGRVELQDIKLETDWREYQPIGDENNDALTITLLSDAIVRDPETGAETVDLARATGLDLTPKFIRTRLVGGFNRKWNLPTPQTRALHAGSVFTAPPSLEARLRELEASGIGERRAEGFGRIAVNWHRLEKVSVTKLSGQHSAPALSKDMPASHFELAKRMVERMARAELDKRLTAAVISLGDKTQLNRLRSSQISRIRLAAREMMRQNSGEPLRLQFDEQKGMKKNARDQFLRARIDGKFALDWLTQFAVDPKDVWRYIDTAKLPTLANVRAELTPALATEYAARLIDGVLRHAQRKDKSND